MVSAWHGDQNRSLGAVPALPAWSRKLSAPAQLLHQCERYRQEGKGQGGSVAMPVIKSRKRTVEVVGGCKVVE